MLNLGLLNLLLIINYLYNNGDFAIIDFIDSGLGIPEEFINKIFEPLFTTKQKGTGLG